MRDYGAVCDLEANLDVVGLILPHQQGQKPLATGAKFTARILDVSKLEGVVDLSAKPELAKPARQVNCRLAWYPA